MSGVLAREHVDPFDGCWRRAGGRRWETATRRARDTRNATSARRAAGDHAGWRSGRGDGRTSGFDRVSRIPGATRRRSSPASSDHGRAIATGRAVIDASGMSTKPSRSVPGGSRRGERALASSSTGIPDVPAPPRALRREARPGRRQRPSAFNVILDLVALRESVPATEIVSGRSAGEAPGRRVRRRRRRRVAARVLSARRCARARRGRLDRLVGGFRDARGGTP